MLIKLSKSSIQTSNLKNNSCNLKWMFRNGAISPAEMAAITKLDKKTAKIAIKRVKEIFVIKFLS